MHKMFHAREKISATTFMRTLSQRNDQYNKKENSNIECRTQHSTKKGTKIKLKNILYFSRFLISLPQVALHAYVTYGAGKQINGIINTKGRIFSPLFFFFYNK